MMNTEAELRNSEPGGFSGELALSHKWRGSTTRGITRDSFAPYRTHYELYRQSSGNGVCVSAGMLTSVNLNFNRDSVLIAGKDWLHYLERRIYPFDPELYKAGEWINWPRSWPDVKGAYGPSHYVANPSQTLLNVGGPPIDVGIIIRELVQATQFDPPSGIDPAAFPRSPQWPGAADATLGRIRIISENVKDLDQETKYKIYPGDSTSIFEHLKKLSEQVDAGFEFDIHPLTRQFQVWNPRRNYGQALPYYVLHGGHDIDEDGQVIEFDWTNDGPEGTYLVGLAKKAHNVGKVWTTQDNLNEFGRYDKLYDFGEIPSDTMVLQLLKDQNDLHPQKRLHLALLNPEFLVPNFYTGGRPRALLGATVSAFQQFPPYHTVNADFRINAIKWNVDGSTNEDVALELEMVYDP